MNETNETSSGPTVQTGYTYSFELAYASCISVYRTVCGAIVECDMAIYCRDTGTKDCSNSGGCSLVPLPGVRTILIYIYIYILYIYYIIDDMCICVYIYMYIHTYLYIYICMYVYVYVYYNIT